MRTLGRTLQVVGLVLPITGFLLAESSMRQQAMTVEFGMLAAGAGIFILGWKLRGETD